MKPPFPNLSGVTEHLTAEHFDPAGEEGWHEHTWEITGYWPAGLEDGRPRKRLLKYVISELVRKDGRLPVELWSAEAMAQAILSGAYGDTRGQGHPPGRGSLGMIAIRITRTEGFETWIWA